MSLQNKIGLAFKREGLVLTGKDVMEYLVTQLKEHSQDAQSFLVALVKGIDRTALRQNFVDLAAVKRAVGVITMDVGAKVTEESLKVISGMDCPRHRYHEARKTFVPLEGSVELHGSADDQARMFRHRFELIRQRLLRHDLFAHHKLSTVESLLGTSGRRVVFGMLTRDNHGELILEDLNNFVKIDIAGAKIDVAFYTDHCMVLADGELIQGKFCIHVLTMPPIEAPFVTLNTFANVEMFGGAHSAALRAAIASYERSADDVMFVVLSDVWLDKPNVMQKLEILFDGYKDIVPTAFIFTGNFTSRPFASTAADVQDLQHGFQSLARLIVKFKSLAVNSTWIFSRGPTDGGGPLVFPQFPLPDYFVASLRQKLPKVIFTTNPFRLRWCNRRFVFFRENLVSKMRRHSLFPHLDYEEPHVLLARTLMEQSHLCPLPQPICPVYWNLDQAMHLYPVPDVLVLADAHDQYVLRDDGYTACNPGSFGSDFTFLIVRPSTLEVEESNIPSGLGTLGDEEQQVGAVDDYTPRVVGGGGAAEDLVLEEVEDVDAEIKDLDVEERRAASDVDVGDDDDDENEVSAELSAPIAKTQLVPEDDEEVAAPTQIVPEEEDEVFEEDEQDASGGGGGSGSDDDSGAPHNTMVERE